MFNGIQEIIHCILINEWTHMIFLIKWISDFYTLISSR